MPETLHFLGRLHPLLLHVPIGLIVGVAFFEIAFAKRMSVEMRRATGVLMALSAVSALITATFGFILADAGGYDEQLVTRHRVLGIAVAATALLASGLHHFATSSGSSTALASYRAVLASCVGVLVFAGHFGASITHGANYLGLSPKHYLAGADFAESPLLVGRFLGTSVFHSSIEPILEEHCTECHGEAKQKSGLRLDSRDAALHGGDSGEPAIIPGNAMSSRLVWAITLPTEHDQAMPPIGKQRLDPDEVMLIIDWIHRGAAWKDPLEVMAESVESVPNEVLETLRTKGVRTSRLARGLPFVRVDALPHASELSVLDPIASQVTWLDLGSADLSSKDWQRLARMNHLTRLELQHSNLSDDALVHFEGLHHLVYLNLYGTPVSDAGLLHLEKLESLEKLYLWQTHVTDAGARRLRDAIPALQINLGLTNAVQ